ISCKKEGSILLPSLELRTMNVRDLYGHERYQVPDDAVRTYAVCRDCAEAYLRGAGGRLTRKLLSFGLVLAVGLCLTIFSYGREQVFFMTGLAALFCGAAGLITSLRDQRRSAAEEAGLSTEERLTAAAWQVFLKNAPTQMQDGLWKLTYLPVNEKTLSTKPGDLTVLYEIHPSVAKEVMQKIGHPQA
ncbi:MAG: hypothetical protein ACSW8F_03440, partial [bacterium]